MTTEVLRNMLYARSPALDGLGLRRARRGPLPPGPLPRPGVGGGDHPPAARRCGSWPCRPRCPTPTSWPGGSTRCGAAPRRWSSTAGPVELLSLYAAATGRATSLVVIPTLVDGEPNPMGEQLDANPLPPGRHRATGAGPATRRPAGSRSSTTSPTRTCCPPSTSSSAAAAATRPARRASTPGCASPTADERDRIRAIVERAHRGPDRRRPRRARLRPVAGRPGGGHRRPPRRHGAAVQGGRRGLLRRRASSRSCSPPRPSPSASTCRPGRSSSRRSPSSPASSTSRSPRASTRS